VPKFYFINYIERRLRERPRLHAEPTERLTAVSYTHLDVYKRQESPSQAQICAESGQRHPVTNYRSDFVGLPLDPPNFHESKVEKPRIKVAEPGQLVHNVCLLYTSRCV